MLVSPAEPPPYNTLGRSSSLPEQYGADFLMFSPLFGRVGVQRKTVTDLVASLSDGRVARELIEMKGLDVGVWLIEGNLEWTSDGQAVGVRTPYSTSRHYATLFSMLSKGFWLLQATNQQECLKLLSQLEGWMAKGKHSGMSARPTPRGNWGQPTLEEQRVHFLQGVNGVGYERARAAVKHFGGLPLQLTGNLLEVPGWGKGMVGKVEEIIGEE